MKIVGFWEKGSFVPKCIKNANIPQEATRAFDERRTKIKNGYRLFILKESLTRKCFAVVGYLHVDNVWRLCAKLFEVEGPTIERTESKYFRKLFDDICDVYVWSDECIRTPSPNIHYIASPPPIIRRNTNLLSIHEIDSIVKRSLFS
jgi:hypothetical protein